MHAAEGIVTTRGGMTSHAAVVARGMGKPCVAGAGAIHIDYAEQNMNAGGVTLKRGDILTIDGGTGHVMQGAAPSRCRTKDRQPVTAEIMVLVLGGLNSIRSSRSSSPWRRRSSRRPASLCPITSGR
jgi:phosphoenolpyruvate synthase/pyruvate phosphate dikinase